jgi:hypothetical protein
MTPTGWQQSRQPAPGELWASFQQRLAGYEDKLKGWTLAKALTAADVDAALAGSPRVLLATEGANFLEGRARARRTGPCLGRAPPAADSLSSRARWATGRPRSPFMVG